MPLSIALAGKGGTGKSTISALLLSRLVQRDMGPILAVDADPDSNFGTLLGMARLKSIGELREEVLKSFKTFPAGMTKAQYMEAGLHEIIEEFDGFDLVTMGHGEGSGCYCYLNSLIRKFSQDLSPSYKWVVMDNEAGLEHISRRTTDDINALIVVVNENPLSLDCAQRVKDLAGELKGRIYKTYVVTNSIRANRLDGILEKVKAIGMEHLCNLEFDPNLEEIIFNGEPIHKQENLAAHDTIDFIIDKVGG
jgi:CO dehydrogenase maturation factor